MTVHVNSLAANGSGGTAAAVAGGGGVGAAFAFITGGSTVGSVLTANVVGAVAVSWQWFIDGSLIGGATASTYTTVSAGVLTVTINGVLTAPGVVITASSQTVLQARLIGINLPTWSSALPTRAYVDYTRRSPSTWNDVSTGLPVALKGNFCPASSYTYNLGTAYALDLLTYNCWMPGTASNIVAAMSGGTAITSALTYDAPNDRTTFTIQLVSGSGFSITVTNPSGSSGYIRIIPPGFNQFTNADDFHPDFLAQMANFAAFRGMDWLKTNSSPDTVWAGSTAAGGDGTVRSGVNSLSEMIRLGNLGLQDLHVNAPAGALDDWYTGATTLLSGTLNTSLFVDCEVGNENWNPLLGAPPTNYTVFIRAAVLIAGTFAGQDPVNTLVSVVRASNVVTVTLSGPPATSGPFFMGGVTSITGGFIDVAGKGLAISGNTFTYNEVGADVTGTVATGNYNSYVSTNLAHYLVKAPVSFGTPSANGVDPYSQRDRYSIERLRAWWTIAQTFPDKARFRFILNGQEGTHDYAYRSYALDRFGDDGWISEIKIAPYIGPTLNSSIITMAQVFTLMQATLAQKPAILIKASNAARGYRPVGSTVLRKAGFYEGGPALFTVVYPPNTAQVAAAVGAASRDPQMLTIVRTLGSYMRDLGAKGVFHHYRGGADQNWSAQSNNSTWGVAELTSGDLTGPKMQGLIQYGADTSVPQTYTAALHPEAPLDLTWGNISFPNVYAATYGNGDTNGNRVVGVTSIVPDIVVLLVPPAAGTYNIDAYIGDSANGDWVTVYVNDIEVAHQIAPTKVTGMAAPTTPFFSQSVTLNAGDNELRFQVKPATRAGFILLNHIVAS